MPRRLWITRTQPGADRSAKAWAKAGFDPVVTPLLTICKADDIGPLDPDTALIFTSANGVRYSSLKGDGRPVYVIGEATAEAAQKAGFTDIRISGGNWKTLLQIIEKQHKLFVHISGRHIRGRIVDALREAGHRAERRIVYRTDPVRQWPLDPSSIDIVAFYSPMASTTFLALKDGYARADGAAGLLHFVCLSEAVAAPLRAASYPGQSISVATEPTERALIKAASDACSDAVDD